MSETSVQRSLTARQGLCVALALSILGLPARPAIAAPSAEAEGSEMSDGADDPGADADADADAEELSDGSDAPDLVVESDEPERATGIGGGNVISSDDPEAKRARADLEGTSMLSSDAPTSDVPERLPPLQRAAWWTMFGTFALATTGGVFAGMAEVQEDRALRLASTIDLTTGGSFLYGDKQAEYQEILDKGELHANLARGFLIGAGVTLIAGIALFAVDGKRSKKKSARAHLRPSRGGLEVRF